MGIEENKAIVKQFKERMGKGDTSILDEIATSNSILHEMGTGRDIDSETLKRVNTCAHSAFLDFSVAIDDIVAEGDIV